MASPKQYTVVYRIGGTHRFEWRRTDPFLTLEAAQIVKANIERMGYCALGPQDYRASMSVGLPETHCVEASCPCEKLS